MYTRWIGTLSDPSLLVFDASCIPAHPHSVALASNIGLNITLIPAWGLAGAATATAAAMTIEALLLHVAVRRALGIVVFAFADPHALTPRTEAVRP